MWRAEDQPIVWLDADATVEATPSLFSVIDADFAAHKWNGWKLAGGTLYFGKTELAGALIDRWVARCQADPLTWDQTHLQSAWCDIASETPLRTVWLPRSYCQIFDSSQKEPPIILHWQASRIEQRAGRKSQPEVSISPQGQIDRREDRLWRASGAPTLALATGSSAEGNPAGIGQPAGLVTGLATALGRDRPVLEFGCGTGQTAALMQPADYIGIDANPLALRQAREHLPSHVFRLVDAGYSLPAAPSALLWSSWFDADETDAIESLKAAAVGRRRVVIERAASVERWRAVSSRNVCWTIDEWIRMADAASLVLIDTVPLSARSEAKNPPIAGFPDALLVFGAKARPAFKSRWPWSKKQTKDPEVGYYTKGRSLSDVPVLTRAEI
jgi:SAM-dependent methyltransferase